MEAEIITPQRKSTLFTDIYFPKDFEEFIGNVEIVDFTIDWAKKWSEGKKQKPLLFFGSPGVGKTALALLTAKVMNWQLFESNASDLRNKEEIEKVAGAAAGNASLFGGLRLVLLDEIDCLQVQDRGGASAIASIVKESNNPVILTANDLYGDKKLLPFRTICELKEFKKINYLSIAKKLREICDKENISYEDEAIKELAKNSSGDYRSALLDIHSLSPNITLTDVKNLDSRQRKEKVFSVLTKIFKGHDLKEINQFVYNSEIPNDLLIRWIEENIPRQFDSKDSAKAFDYLSKGDIFNGRIMRRQHYSFLKYSNFLSTTAVGLSRLKDYHSFTPFQFPSLLNSLSANSSSRALRKSIAKKVAKKIHCSSSQAVQDMWLLSLLIQSNNAEHLVLGFDFDEKEIMFLLGGKKEKKAEELLTKSKELEKKIIYEKSFNKQSKLFG
ncbi:MAG TPA: replication factor C large subunit [archaeon]|nr:replication factor C large subunit [archaeon]